jgi:hypothetical protein
MQQCGRLEESSPEVDKKTFLQLGSSNNFYSQKKNQPQEGISDQKGWKSLPEA